MGEKVDCQYLENCTSRGEKCQTCSHNSVKDYYQPATGARYYLERHPNGAEYIYSRFPIYNYQD